jgi:hypothetical protein
MVKENQHIVGPRSYKSLDLTYGFEGVSSILVIISEILTGSGPCGADHCSTLGKRQEALSISGKMPRNLNNSRVLGWRERVIRAF